MNILHKGKAVLFGFFFLWREVVALHRVFIPTPSNVRTTESHIQYAQAKSFTVGCWKVTTEILRTKKKNQTTTQNNPHPSTPKVFSYNSLLVKLRSSVHVAVDHHRHLRLHSVLQSACRDSSWREKAIPSLS